MDNKKNGERRSKIVENYKKRMEWERTHSCKDGSPGEKSGQNAPEAEGPLDFVYDYIEPKIDQRIDHRVEKTVKEAMKKMEDEKVVTVTQADYYLSIHTAAVLVDTSDRTIRNIIKNGKLVPYKFGGQIKVKKMDVLALIERADKTPKPEDQ